MVVKTVFFLSRGHFWRNTFLFHKIFKIFSCFQTLRKTFGFLAKIILLGCQNCFQVSRGYFWKSLFLKTNSLNCFFSFSLRVQIFCTFSENFAIGLSKLHSMCPVENFDWTVFPTKIHEYFHRPRAVRKTLWHFGAKASKSLSKRQFMRKKISVEKLIFEKTFTIFSSTDQKFCDFWQKSWVIEKLWVRLFFSPDKIHVVLRKLKEKLFCGR